MKTPSRQRAISAVIILQLMMTSKFIAIMRTHNIRLTLSERAFKTIDDEIYSREIAVIYYLTEDWKEEYGGKPIVTNFHVKHV